MSKIKMVAPVIITPRLLPGVQIGTDSWVSVDPNTLAYYIDTPNYEHEGDDLHCPCGGIQGALTALLSFLGAFVEAVQYSQGDRESENLDLFPIELREWAAKNSDEIAMLECELDETENAIVCEG